MYWFHLTVNRCSYCLPTHFKHPYAFLIMFNKPLYRIFGFCIIIEIASYVYGHGIPELIEKFLCRIAHVFNQTHHETVFSFFKIISCWNRKFRLYKNNLPKKHYRNVPRAYAFLDIILNSVCYAELTSNIKHSNVTPGVFKKSVTFVLQAYALLELQLMVFQDTLY